MADEQESAPKRGLVKLILLGVAGLVILGGLGFGVRLLLKRRAAAKAAAAKVAGVQNPPADDDGCGDAGGGEEGASSAPVMVVVRNVNLSGPRLNAFLHCELDIVFCDQELGKLASSDKPSPEKGEIEAIVLDALSGRSVEEASDPGFRDSLRQDIRDKLNAQFGAHPLKPGEAPPKKKKPRRPIKDVLIVDWAIQQ
ncbi:MAG: flagellar basal body-associated FliL family protein [Acidobacteriota bacterium]|nr:flagellar basal body-associated FliL family protein [Acidobacteriota bacterium]